MTDRADIKVLFDDTTIAARNLELAEEIKAAGYREDVVVIAVLKGSFVFAADLIRALDRVGLAPEVDFVSLASYGEGTVSSGTVRVVRDFETAVAGRNVLLVDDILESGRTLAFAKSMVAERGAARVGVAVLLDKPGKRAVGVEADFVGFTAPDIFVVGYGMDAAHAWRQLPFIGYIE